MNRHGIHYAQLETSPRLQRLLKFLSDGRARTTLEIIQQAQVCAVSTAIKELRMNGFEIECRPVRRGVYEYQMKLGVQQLELI